MVKLVIVDMDGTFLNDDKKMSPEFDKIFKYLTENNIVFCAASGRQLASLKKEFKGYEKEMVFVAENGSVVELNGEIIKVEKLNAQVTEKILNRLNYLNDKKVVYCGAEYSYISGTDEDSRRNAEMFLPKHKIVNDFEEIDELPVKISIYSKDGYDQDFQTVIDEFGDLATVCTSGYTWLDIIKKGSNKGNSIEMLQKKLDISKEETMVFGDQMNDFEMMNRAYYSYAMENAVDEIKQISRFSAPSNNEFGVVVVLKEFFGIK